MGEFDKPFESEEHIVSENGSIENPEQPVVRAVPEDWFSSARYVGRSMAEGFFNPDDVIIKPKEQPRQPVTFIPTTQSPDGH
jgi:hypothetical protein